jgi:hypothetical protein
VTTPLVTVSRGRPVVVVLDDLHWADAASIRLLEFVARHAWFERLLLVGCYRDVEVEAPGHPLGSLLAPPARQGHRGAVDRAGGARRLGDASERARKAVSERIRDTLRRLDRRHPTLARHLRASVSTGTTCRYQPSANTSWTR